ncbi:FadR family transcriptional regulator, partial [Escherichia coli]|nr:FadR family transcriptional regulator [Escherichia coli]
HRALSEHKTLSISWSHYREQRVNIPYAGLDKRSGDKNVLIKLNQQHKAIIEAIRAGNADNALQRALLHLKYVREIIGY